MGILHLTLHRKWFCLIASGSKRIEYRQDTPYWHKRIFADSAFSRRFDEIHFRNGYGHHRPLIVVEFLHAFTTHASLCFKAHGEQIDGRVIVIALGNILRTENYHPAKPMTCGGCRADIAPEESLCDGCSSKLLEGHVPWVEKNEAEKEPQ